MIQLTGVLVLTVLFVAVGAWDKSNLPPTAGSLPRYELLAKKVSKATSMLSDNLKMATSPTTASLVKVSRVKKPRRRKGRKGTVQRGKTFRLSNYEIWLRKMKSRNAADRECQKWSPDLRVKVNTTEVAIIANYCTDSASPKAQTCVEEVSPSSHFSMSRPRCQILDQGNCSTIFPGLAEGKWYNITIKGFCRCEERPTDPCAVTRFFRGPYYIDLPVTTQIVNKAQAGAHNSEFVGHMTWAFPVFFVAFLALAFGTAVLCWLKRRPKQSSETPSDTRSRSFFGDGSRSRSCETVEYVRDGCHIEENNIEECESFVDGFALEQSGPSLESEMISQAGVKESGKLSQRSWRHIFNRLFSTIHRVAACNKKAETTFQEGQTNTSNSSFKRNTNGKHRISNKSVEEGLECIELEQNI